MLILWAGALAYGYRLLIAASLYGSLLTVEVSLPWFTSFIIRASSCSSLAILRLYSSYSFNFLSTVVVYFLTDVGILVIVGMLLMVGPLVYGWRWGFWMKAANSCFCFSTSYIICRLISPACLLTLSWYSFQCAASALSNCSSRALCKSRHWRYRAKSLVSTPSGFYSLSMFSLIRIRTA